MWTLWKSKVATRLHHRNPHGPQLDGQSLHISSHSNLYFSRPQSCLETIHRPLPTEHPKDPEGGQLAGIHWNPPSQPPKPISGNRRTSLTYQTPRVHKSAFALSARRYGFGTMNYSGVVSIPVHHGSVCHATGNNRPVYHAETHHRSDVNIVRPETAVESSVMLANPHRTVMCRGGWS